MVETDFKRARYAFASLSTSDCILPEDKC